MARERGLAQRQRGELQRTEPWDTFREMERMFQDFMTPMMRPSRWMREHVGEFMPEVDLKETDKEFTLTATLPGMQKDDIDIDVTNDSITIKGERKQEEEKPEERYHIRQTSYGRFNISYSLPSDVKPEDVNASYKNGVLEIHLPKAEEAKAHKVDVKVE